MTALSGSNVHYFYFPAEYCLRNLSTAGFREMELYLGTPHVFIDRNCTDEFDDIFSLAEKHGVRISSVHPETISFRYTLCHPDPEWNEKSVLAYERCVDYAAARGISALRTDIAGSFRDLPQQAIFTQVYHNLVRLAGYALERGVSVSLETTGRNYQGFLTDLPTLEHLLDMLDKACPDVFDVGLNLDSIFEANETADSWMETFGGRIRYIRLSNPNNLSGICQRVSKYGFRGSLQFYPLDDDSLLAPADADRRFMECAETVGETWR